MQILMFDPGGVKGRLRTCPFFGNVARVALWGGFVRALDEAAAFLGGWMTRNRHFAGEVQASRLHGTYCGQSLFLCSQAGLKMSYRQRRHEAI